MGGWVRGGCRKRQCCLICCPACPFLTALLPAPWERGALLRLAQAAGSGAAAPPETALPRRGNGSGSGLCSAQPSSRCRRRAMQLALCVLPAQQQINGEELSTPPRAGRAAQPLGDVPVAGALFAPVNAAAGCHTPRVPPNPPGAAGGPASGDAPRQPSQAASLPTGLK